MSQSTWSRIENGNSALTIDQLNLAADALGTQPSRLLHEADEAVRSLKSRGVRVEPERGVEAGPALAAGLILLSAVALGLMIAKK